MERHRLALSQAPARFAGENMAKPAYEAEQEGAVALFYTVAGQSLQNFRTLASQERQGRLEALFAATNDYLLTEWNAAAAFEQALHPQKLLERWLGYCLKPESSIASFLKGVFLLERDCRLRSRSRSLASFPRRQRPRGRVSQHDRPGLWMLGFPDRALERADGALALAHRLNHPFSLAYALFHTGLLHLWRRGSGGGSAERNRAKDCWASLTAGSPKASRPRI
jgi:hypothetical protein